MEELRSIAKIKSEEMKAAKEAARQKKLTELSDEDRAKYLIKESAEEQAKKKKSASFKEQLEKKRDQAKQKAKQPAAAVNEEL